MGALTKLKSEVRLIGLDPNGFAEILQVSQFGPDALNVWVDGRVSERLVYRGKERSFEVLIWRARKLYALNAFAIII